MSHEPQMLAQIDVLHKEYTARKFLLDCRKNIFDNEKFFNSLFNIYFGIVNYHHFGKSIKKITDDINFSNQEKIIEALDYCKENKDYFQLVDDAILKFHNDDTDNPEFVCERRQSIDEERTNCIVSVLREEVVFLREVCLGYGYFPNELIFMTNPLTSIKAFQENRLPTIFPFIRPADYSTILKAYFISDSGKCYFEKEDNKKLYIYCDTSAYSEIDDILEAIGNNLKKRGKKNFNKRMDFSNAPNMQLCVNKTSELDINVIMTEIKCTLCCAFMYFNFSITLSVMPTKKDVSTILGTEVETLITDRLKIQKHIIETFKRATRLKYKKVSFFKRCVGLYIWDRVHIDNEPIGDVIESLMAYNGDIDIFHERIKLFRSLKNEKTQEMAKLIYEDCQKKTTVTSANSIGEHDTIETKDLEFSELRRQYDLARKCICGQSVCAHG